MEFLMFYFCGVIASLVFGVLCLIFNSFKTEEDITIGRILFYVLISLIPLINIAIGLILAMIFISDGCDKLYELIIRNKKIYDFLNKKPFKKNGNLND